MPKETYLLLKTRTGYRLTIGAAHDERVAAVRRCANLHETVVIMTKPEFTLDYCRELQACGVRCQSASAESIVIYHMHPRDGLHEVED